MIIYAADHPLVLDGTYDQEGYKPGERARITKAKLLVTKGSTMATRSKKADKPHRVNTHKTNGSASSSTEVAPPGKRRPRQQDLPGTEDRAIKPLEDIAAAYAEVRDRRMALNKEEAELKVHALKLMHKYEKTIYRHDGIEIRIIDGEEDVKVKVKKPGEDQAEDGDDEISAGEANA